MQPLAADRPLTVGVICFAVRLDGFGGILPVLANAAIYVDTRDIVIPRQGECDRVCAMCFGISKRGLKVCPSIGIRAHCPRAVMAIDEPFPEMFFPVLYYGDDGYPLRLLLHLFRHIVDKVLFQSFPRRFARPLIAFVEVIGGDVLHGGDKLFARQSALLFPFLQLDDKILRHGEAHGPVVLPRLYELVREVEDAVCIFSRDGHFDHRDRVVLLHERLSRQREVFIL